jgi:hypothetical protein
MGIAGGGPSSISTLTATGADRRYGNIALTFRIGVHKIGATGLGAPALQTLSCKR